ncbi:hypothetical protein HPB51_012381 [Rhipicephalus microplus]|uniref:C2H2-type domain-containing protein n=1 Tax=Rhipicephalus microplus TaxID=6941 RepID=A0A9J6DGH8_RHIMP|nr:hypothetical protein HPB51_012381 [Rhipicephalus microplus]
MPPRKNTARRGRPWAKFGNSGDRTAQDEASDGAAVVALSDDNMTKPGSPAKKAATPARKVPAAPKPRPGAAAIEQPAAKKRAVAATKPAAEKAVRTVSEASEDDGAFEALVLDADDDEDVPAGDEENVAEDGNEEDAAASRDENDEEGDAEEPLGGAEVAEDDVEGWVDEAAEGDLNEEGGEVEEGGDHIEAVDVKAEGGLEGDAERDNAPGEDASDGDPEASAEGNEGAEPQANGVKIENGGEEDTAAAGEGETIVRDLAPSERDFVMAEDEEVKEEPTREVSRLWDLCPDVELEQAETITASLHESIRRSDIKHKRFAISQDDQPMFGCSLCNVKMHKPELFDTHVGTQRHVKRLRWMYFMGMNKELGNYHCRVCQISVPCRDHLVGHLRSDRHLCLSKSLNVHPKYSEHVLLQFYPEGNVHEGDLSQGPEEESSIVLFLASSAYVQRCCAALLRIRNVATRMGALPLGAQRPSRKRQTCTPDLLTAAKLCSLSRMFMAISLFFCSTDEVKSLLQPQPQQQQQQQQPSATTSQPSATGKGKGQKSADKRPDKGKANAGSTGQQSTRDQSPPASASQGFIFHCEVCQVIAYHEDQIQEHYKGKKHRAKMAEELEKLSKQKPDDPKKGAAPRQHQVAAQATLSVLERPPLAPTAGAAKAAPALLNKAPPRASTCIGTSQGNGQTAGTPSTSGVEGLKASYLEPKPTTSRDRSAERRSNASHEAMDTTASQTARAAPKERRVSLDRSKKDKRQITGPLKSPVK